MLYALHEMMQAQARMTHAAFAWGLGWQRAFLPSSVRAIETLSDRATRAYDKPAWDIPVEPELVEHRAFGDLIRFPGQGPKMLIIAAMSGHYATLLRPMVAEFLGTYDVYVTDWANAREVPVEAGTFDLDDYTGYLVDWIEELGPDTNVVAVCQAAVPALAAVSWLAQQIPEAQPATLTLISGPISPPAAHSTVSERAVRLSQSSFERLITTVPRRHPGAGRQVYPGFLQLAAFLGLDPGRHLDAHWDLHRALVSDDVVSADKIASFYDEYFAVCDMTAEFYLSTIDRVFRNDELGRGVMEYRGTRIDPAAIDATAVLTIEGGKDEICPPGQTAAAHALCSGLPERMRSHHLEPSVGHYGTFSGSRFRKSISPELQRFTARHRTVPTDREVAS